MTVTTFPAPVEDLLCLLTRNLINNPSPAQQARLARLIAHTLGTAHRPHPQACERLTPTPKDQP